MSTRGWRGGRNLPGILGINPPQGTANPFANGLSVNPIAPQPPAIPQPKPLTLENDPFKAKLQGLADHITNSGPLTLTNFNQGPFDSAFGQPSIGSQIVSGLHDQTAAPPETAIPLANAYARQAQLDYQKSTYDPNSPNYIKPQEVESDPLEIPGLPTSAPGRPQMPNLPQRPSARQPDPITAILGAIAGAAVPSQAGNISSRILGASMNDADMRFADSQRAYDQQLQQVMLNHQHDMALWNTAANIMVQNHKEDSDIKGVNANMANAQLENKRKIYSDAAGNDALLSTDPNRPSLFAVNKSLTARAQQQQTLDSLMERYKLQQDQNVANTGNLNNSMTLQGFNERNNWPMLNFAANQSNAIQGRNQQREGLNFQMQSEADRMKQQQYGTGVTLFDAQGRLGVDKAKLGLMGGIGPNSVTPDGLRYQQLLTMAADKQKAITQADVQINQAVAKDKMKPDNPYVQQLRSNQAANNSQLADFYREIGEIQQRVNSKPGGRGKPLNDATAQQILKEAGGDNNKAREIARQRGFSP